MTTRRGTRLNNAALRNAIGDLLEDDPDLSREAILRRLRSQGISVGNQRGRATAQLVQQARQAEQQLGNALQGGFRSRLSNATELLRLTFDVEASTPNIRRRVLEAADAERQSNNASHVRINYRARFTADVYLYGSKVDTISDTVTGGIVQPLERYNRDLIEARIEQQITGRITREFSGEPGSYVEGIEIVITSVDVNIESAQLRGNAAR